LPHPYRGREFIHMAKLKTAIDKVKFMDGGFFTLVLTFFLIIFYSRIVDSEFCCMFTPTNKQTTKNTTIMKNLTITETIQQIDTWIEDVQFDLTQDWNDDKELMSVQLQQLMVAKSNLELILKTGGQIFDSSIQK